MCVCVCVDVSAFVSVCTCPCASGAPCLSNGVLGLEVGREDREDRERQSAAWSRLPLLNLSSRLLQFSSHTATSLEFLTFLFRQQHTASSPLLFTTHNFLKLTSLNLSLLNKGTSSITLPLNTRLYTKSGSAWTVKFEITVQDIGVALQTLNQSSTSLLKTDDFFFFFLF